MFSESETQLIRILLTLSVSPNSVRVIRSLGMTEVRGTHGKDKGLIQNFSRNTSRKRPLYRHKHSIWEDDIKTDLKEIRREYVQWIRVTQDTVQWRSVVNTIMITWVL
jgi:hypothetical protein